MREITLEELLEAGCHFGHQVTRQNPKAREFIFEARDGIHIIDLAKTKEDLEEAAAFVKTSASQGHSLVVVGTKRQAQTIVEEEVKRARAATVKKDPSTQSPHSSSSGQNIFYVNTRWLGGTLTNSSEVAKNYKKLKELTSRLKDEEEKVKYTKKEIGQWEKERQKLQALYGGIADMKKLPDALFIIDTHWENLAVQEARKMGIATVGIVDTNADPALVDYPIPANDDAVGSLKLIVQYIIDAWIEGKMEKEAGSKNSANAKTTEDKQESRGKVSDVVKKVKKQEKTEEPVKKKRGRKKKEEK